MPKINFFVFSIIKDSTEQGERFLSLSKDDFNYLNEKDFYNSSEHFHLIHITKKEDCIFFVFDYGSPTPRPEEIHDRLGKSMENPRSPDKAELRDQFFVLVKYPDTLYLSNSKKKNLILDYLKNKINIQFEIHTIYKTIDQFINILKEVNQISFTHLDDVFGTGSKEQNALIDLTGVDAPLKFKLTAEYSKKDLSNLIPFIKNMFQRWKDNKIKSLYIIGRSDDDFGVIYNSDTFSQKFSIDCTKNSEDKYNAEDVLNAILKELDDEKK